MIDDRLTFGIDLGIGSCGWAVLRDASGEGGGGAIVGLGSWCFDVPETADDHRPTNQIRLGYRLLRRVIRRRRKRMLEIRKLFHDNGLLPTADADVPKKPGLDPWELRARGLDEPLDPREFAVALGHIAKRRGFKSSAKRKAANKSPEESKLLSALETTQERLALYRTVGEMFARDPAYIARRRNRDGLFDRTVGRDDLVREVGKLFAEQRRLGRSFATADLEEAFTGIAFRQLPMQDSERLVGPCLFESNEKRAAKLAPSFERFRLLVRLVNLRIKTADGERPLRPDEIALVTADLGKTAKLSASRVRRLIKLDEASRFTTINREDEQRDIAVRTGEALPGTAALRKILGEVLWAAMSDRAEQLDAIAHVLSFFETTATISEKLAAIGLEPEVFACLSGALDSPAMGKFKGAAHLSANACRRLVPYLSLGNRYDEACRLAGYDHAASAASRGSSVTTKAEFNALVATVGDAVANPVARKALKEGLKQLWALRNRWGLPGRIHIEVARDVGNSAEKRREIEQQIEKNTVQRDRERSEVAALLDLPEVDGDTLLRYRLWKEQAGKCIYTGSDIHIAQVVATDNAVQIDHILPWSRFADDSFNNKCLCLAGANQQKRGRTPYEWFTQEKAETEWDTFIQRVELCRSMRGLKKRNFLLRNADEAAGRFVARNLNDTRYAARVLAEAAKLFYPVGERQEKGGNRRVFTRPGALTAALRHAWGVESLKKIDGKRVSDSRHHALDALVVAAVSESQVQRLTKSFQRWEQQGLSRPLRAVDAPWPGFRRDALSAYERVLVARPERRRARGEGHEAKIRQVAVRDGETTVFERKAIAALKESDLARIKDPERNAAVIDAIRGWMAAGRPADAPPLSPRGDVIGKVRLAARNKPAVIVRGGTADRGEFVRIDLFVCANSKGVEEYYAVPIYRHEIHLSAPPGSFMTTDGREQPLTPAHRFKMSIYNRSFVRLEKRDGRVVEGYVVSFDRSVAALKIAAHDTMALIEKNSGIKTLKSFTKFAVDRFGARAEVKNEVRTWHGVVCTSHDPPD